MLIVDLESWIMDCRCRKIMIDTMAKNIDEFIATFPADVRKELDKIRKVIKEVAPEATEVISYGIPTFKLRENLVHFSAYKNHIGFYPGAEAIEVFAKDLAKYNTTKGTVQFPLDDPIPYDLIRRITKHRVKQIQRRRNRFK